MARARNIKPGFFVNAQLGEVSIPARLLFIALWTQADRVGRLEDRPKTIKIQAFPFDILDADPLLDELASPVDEDGKPAFIIRYEADKRRYIQIVNFEKHQTCHKYEKGKGIPAPDQHGASTVPVQCKHNTSTVQTQCQHPMNYERLNMQDEEPGTFVPDPSKDGPVSDSENDPLSEFPELHGFYPRLWDLIEASEYATQKRPKAGSQADYKTRNVLADCSRLDGYSSADIVAALTWVLTEEPQTTGFTWRKQIRGVGGLRDRCKDGVSKIAHVFEAWRSAQGKTDSETVELSPELLRAAGCKV